MWYILGCIIIFCWITAKTLQTKCSMWNFWFEILQLYLNTRICSISERIFVFNLMERCGVRGNDRGDSSVMSIFEYSNVTPPLLVFVPGQGPLTLERVADVSWPLYPNSSKCAKLLAIKSKQLLGVHIVLSKWVTKMNEYLLPVHLFSSCFS